MFTTILLTVALLLGFAIFGFVIFAGASLAASRKTGWWGLFGGIFIVLGYIVLWCYGVAVAIEWWIEIV